MTRSAAISWGFVIQTAVCAAAIWSLVALAAWARLEASRPALTAQSARVVLTEEFPGAAIEGVWVAADGASARAKVGDQALVVYLRGDDYVARDLAWSAVLQVRVGPGAVRLTLHDIAAPMARLALGANAPWPPVLDGAA